MATVVFSSAYLEINGKNLSAFVTDITPNYAAEMLDETAMGDGTRVNQGGLFNWSFDVTAHNSTSTSNPEAVLWGLVGTTVCVEYRNQNSTGAEGNPILSGIAILENFNRGGGVGSLLTSTFRLVSAGALTRSVSS